MDFEPRLRHALNVTTTKKSWQVSLDWAYAYLYVFRVVVVGTCLVLVPIGWFAHIDWLFNASLCVAIGELIESSYYITVLRWGQRTGRIAPT
jgi:hypothetical protein